MAQYRRAKAGQILTGLDDVDALLKEMQTGAARRAVKAGLIKAARKGARLVKKRIPSLHKDAKKSIGYRIILSSSWSTNGIMIAKFGAAVGLRQYKMDRSKRGKKKGVGIDANNIHWYIMGTGQRTIKKGSQSGWPFAGMSTGRMEGLPVVRETWASSRTDIESTIKRETLDAISREWDKFSKKGRW